MALSVAGSALSKRFRKAHEMRTATIDHRIAAIDEWAVTAKEHVKKWLREDQAPNRIRDVMNQWLKEDEAKSHIVNTKIKGDPHSNA